MKHILPFDDCPECGINLFKHISNDDNIVEVSGKFENFTNEGFQLYRNVYYVCSNCGLKFYVERLSSSIPHHLKK